MSLFPAAIAFAQQFAESLVKQEFASAWGMLSPGLQLDFTVEHLQKSFSAMTLGEPCQLVHDPQFQLSAWPNQQSHEIAWVYIGVLGEGFVEAVTLIVTHEQDQLVINHLEWGRP